jgi:GntR family transcriptional regulator/MocR family aminotransferase
MKVYKKRRDLFCKLLKDELSEVLQFDIPKGGMAIWATLDSAYSWDSVSEVAKKYQLEIGDWTRYDLANIGHNAIRIGFAAYNEEEVRELVARLKKTIEEIKNS